MLFVTVVTAATLEDARRPTMDEYKAQKAEDKAKLDGEDAKNAKMAAVNKVIALFEDLQSQVLAEGEKEVASYNKFACFCKDTTVEKNEAIQTGEDNQAALSTKMTELQEKRDELDDTIEKLVKEIEDAEDEMKKSKRERQAENKVYVGDASDLDGAVSAVRNAIKVLKSSKPSLMQIQAVVQSVRSVVTLADALGFKGSSIHRVATVFSQQDPVPMENYKFHSSAVIDTLETLQDDFRTMKAEVDKTEVQSVAVHDAFMQEKIDFVKAKTTALDKTREHKSNVIKELAEASDKFTTVSAVLMDDKQYLSELARICTDKAKTWDQRSKVRQDELSALAAATDIVKGAVAKSTSAATLRFAQQSVSTHLVATMVQNENALEAAEAAAEAVEAGSGAPTNFLQRGIQRHQPSAQSREEGRQAAIAVLSSQGQKYHSALLASLASQIASDPFAKVKKLVSELIERLLAEAAKESDQKSFCDKSTTKATQKREYAAEKIEELNGRLAKNEAIRDKLNNELDTLKDEIKELNDKKAEAIKMRKEEKAENEATVTEANAGLDALEKALDIVDKFYKTVSKEKVDLELIQNRGPLDDMPDAGFDAGEAYKGAQGESGGILGMLDVIKSDFVRTISETEDAEKEAKSDHFDFLTETAKSLAKKTMAEDQKTKQKDVATQELDEDNDSLGSQSKLLLIAISELLDLKPVCIDTGMSYEERVGRREDEIDSLKKALCIFEHYSEFGPDGTSDC